jgi:hypothetical protein
MSLESRMLAGYLITKGLDTQTAKAVSGRCAERPWRSFSTDVAENRPLIGKKEAMNLAAITALMVNGMDEYPLDQVKGLVACLAIGATSLESILQDGNYFDAGKIDDLLGSPDKMLILEEQFFRSKNKKGGILGMFS